MVTITKKEKHISFFVTVTVVTIFLDQLTKYLVLKNTLNYRLGFLFLHLVKNTGAGFGILQNQALGLAFLSAAVVVMILLYYQKIPKQKLPQFLFALFLGGVVGNLIDRIAKGYVIDFLDFSFWPAFNIADAAITVAVLGIIIYSGGKNN